MSGHSKWSTIKHKKAAIDAKRGKIFSKLVKEITIAAKVGGADLSANIRLRTAVEKAKSNSMPSKNIESAIKKGTGDKAGLDYEEVVYEGYGPHGVALMVHCLTDNKNRTVSNIRSILSKNGGNLGEGGSVAWQFEKKGTFYIARDVLDEEAILEISLDLGSEDVLVSEEGYVVLTSVETFGVVLEGLKQRDIPLINAEITMEAKNTVGVSKEVGEKISHLVELLDDLEDVQSVSSNEKIASS